MVERYYPEHILVEGEVRHLPLTQTIIERLHGVPVTCYQVLPPVKDACRSSQWFERQRTLVLCKNRGRFFEPCPGTKNYLCCGYFILNYATNCHLNCSYCILQAYLNNPYLVVYTNTDEMFKELDNVLTRSPDKAYRIGTGEYTDSLILDHLTSFTRTIVPYFAKRERAFLELKTKTDFINNLEGLTHQKHTIVSWSLNPEPVIASEEKSTSSLDDRLKAARQCQEWGYPLGFHFDPLLYYSGWEKDYQEVVGKLFQTIDPDSLVWISLGCFRFIPSLKTHIKERFPESRILCQEFIRGLDGKMRYFKPIRIEMYSTMAEWIRSCNQDAFIYLCMESQEVWQKSLGYAPRSNHELQSWLLDRCHIKGKN